MKILQLIYESLGSPFGFGGAGVRAYEIYRRLKDRHDITLLCMRYPGAKDGEIEGLYHRFVGTESKSLHKSVLSYTLQSWRFIKDNANSFDVVVENFLPSTPFFTRSLTKKPVILQVQGIMQGHSLKKFSPLYSVPMFLVERFYPLFYSNFIFVSEVTRQKLLSSPFIKVKTCSVIPNGIDRNLLEVTPHEEDYLLFFSRIDIYTKGLDILIRAFEMISDEFPTLRLVLAGYEFDPISLLLSGCSESLKKRIDFIGFVSGHDKVRILSGAKIVLLPSRHESAPVSIVEASACAKPVIVSDIPELSFVKDNGFGLSFRSGSAEQLAGCIRDLLSDDEARMVMGQKGRAYAQGFLWDDIALRFEEELMKVVGV